MYYDFSSQLANMWLFMHDTDQVAGTYALTVVLKLLDSGGEEGFVFLQLHLLALSLHLLLLQTALQIKLFLDSDIT